MDHQQDDEAEQGELSLPSTEADEPVDSDDFHEVVDLPLFSFMVGIRQDLAARLPLYKSDWTEIRSIYTVLNATCFAAVIQLIPALIFAELMDRQTQGNLATAETLVSSAVIGIIYAMFAGQPLVIVGISGPVAILLGASFSLHERFEADYFVFFFWTCFWAGLLHILSSMVGLVSLVWKVTPFTSQIFELFIAITFLYDSLRDLVGPIYFGQGTDRADRGAQYASLVVGFLTFFIAWLLHFADTWVYFTPRVCVLLSAYNSLLAVVIGTAFSYLPGVDQAENGVGGMDRVNVMVPWDWKPTADRNWIVDPFDGIGTAGIVGAMIPGFMFFLLFIIDHNVSSILTQSPKFNLKKPPAYHWDFFVLGITFFPCALLGLPPGNGLLPQAPLHCRALCTRAYVDDDGSGKKREVVTHCEEQRWSGLIQACLMFVALASFTVLSWIPRGCLFGLFLYLGMGSLHSNEIWERVTLCFMVPEHRPRIPVVHKVSNWRVTQAWTLIQAAIALGIFGVAEFASFGYIYPALLTALVPFRSYVLERLFDAADLRHLDPAGESEDDYTDEQKAVHAAQHQVVDDGGCGGDQPSRAEFRCGGMLEALREKEKLLHDDDAVMNAAGENV